MMFCPEGYLTLSELRGLFAIYAQYKIPAQSQSYLDGLRDLNRITYMETEAYSDWLMMSFLIVFSGEIRAVLRSGLLVRIEGRLLHPEIELDEFGPIMTDDDNYPVNSFYAEKLSHFPEDHVGRIQAADFTIPNVDMLTMTFRRRQYIKKRLRKAAKTLNKRPLCIAENSLPLTVEATVSKIESSIRSVWFPDKDSQPEEKQRISHLIIDAMRAGQVVKKAEAKRQFGYGMKTEEFNATWREVSREIPEASKPGPKPRKK